MKLLSAFLIILIAASAIAQPARSIKPASIDELNKLAEGKTKATSNVPLATADSAALEGADVFGDHHLPNYVLALGLLPKAAKPMAVTFKTYLYGGSIAPETKMAVGLRIAQIWHSPYVAVHLQRLMRASETGKSLLAAMQKDGEKDLKGQQRLAIRYADLLTRDIHGVTDEDFKEVRGYFNDSQIVELSMVTCFFNYFVRYCEGAGLPVEEWALKNSVSPYKAPAFEERRARVALVDNDEMNMAGELLAGAANAAKSPNGLGLSIANSQRAFLLVPTIFRAWRDYTGASREYDMVSREIKLHISFAVSMANGCRYCTLHQVLGLRRLGVDPAKLVAMAKDDAALSSRELTAVTFARKLTRDPASVTNADYRKVVDEFKEQGALEILLQTCNFAYMNRFTDGLHLPSEDEAVKNYLETYGKSFEEVRKSR